MCMSSSMIKIQLKKHEVSHENSEHFQLQFLMEVPLLLPGQVDGKYWRSDLLSEPYIHEF